MTPAYLAIQARYGERRAERSRCRYMDHIDEGLDILASLGADQTTMDAWCIHPLVQSDEDFARTLEDRSLEAIAPAVIALAMEYRERANAHLSGHASKVPTAGPMSEVRLMLVADKMQNRRAFEAHLVGRPDVSNSSRLGAYFREWFDALGITEEGYRGWAHEVTS